MNYTINDIIDAMNRNGYPIFTSDNKPFNINIIAVRNSDRVSNTFNDSLFVLYKHKNLYQAIY